MTEDRDHDVQDWFTRSVDELPSQPFTLAVLQQVQRQERQERYWRLQRYAATLLAVVSCCLVLRELIAPLTLLAAALPLILVEVGGERWPVLVIMVIGGTWWLIKYARNIGFLQRA